jgi:hypothetical protein
MYGGRPEIKPKTRGGRAKKCTMVGQKLNLKCKVVGQKMYDGRPEIKPKMRGGWAKKWSSREIKPKM